MATGPLICSHFQYIYLHNKCFPLGLCVRVGGGRRAECVLGRCVCVCARLCVCVCVCVCVCGIPAERKILA